MRAVGLIDDLRREGLAFAPARSAMRALRSRAPAAATRQTVVTCNADGETETPRRSPATPAGHRVSRRRLPRALRLRQPARATSAASTGRVDLDNAMVDSSRNAAAQQFAIVVSNPQPDVAAEVTIEQDDALAGRTGAAHTVASADDPAAAISRPSSSARARSTAAPTASSTPAPAPRSPATPTASRASVPIVAYQFNPLENVNVFSNDASLLKPVEALTYSPGTLGQAYVVVGWPQTIATTDDPEHQLRPADPTDLRAFLTIVGTRPTPRSGSPPARAVIAGGPVARTAARRRDRGHARALRRAQPRDGRLQRRLHRLGHRRRPAGRRLLGQRGLRRARFRSSSPAASAAPITSRSSSIPFAPRASASSSPTPRAAPRPSRTRAASSASSPSPNSFASSRSPTTGATVQTSLPPPDDRFHLARRGDVRDLIAFDDVLVQVGRARSSSATCRPARRRPAYPRGLPGGDPSLVIVPPGRAVPIGLCLSHARQVRVRFHRGDGSTRSAQWCSMTNRSTPRAAT